MKKTHTKKLSSDQKRFSSKQLKIVSFIIILLNTLLNKHYLLLKVEKDYVFNILLIGCGNYKCMLFFLCIHVLHTELRILTKVFCYFMCMSIAN